MKKFLRFVGVILLVIVAGVVILGLIAPKDVALERSIAINAPRSAVAEQMLYYKNFHNWSPWQKMDSNMQATLTGEDGRTGAKYEWKGNKKVVSGEMNITGNTEGPVKDQPQKHFNSVNYNMTFREPIESTAEGYWRVEDADNGQSKAIWGFSTHVPFPMNGIMMVMGMGSLTKDFDEGLQNLKTYTETHLKDMPTADIRTIQFSGKTYAAIKKQIPISNMEGMSQFFSNSFGTLGKAAGDRVNGDATGLFFKWDEKNDKADLAAAFPVSDGDPIAGAELVQVGPSKGYEVTHQGGYAATAQIHDAIMKHISQRGEEVSLAMEEYVKGQHQEPDSNKWVTNIIYLVK
ncbi:MAG TPA: SRPBCC family protein [Flavipsychrobacter sp.]|nr:SRPBCC family protein [Flavipsychrobacter sp.]